MRLFATLLLLLTAGLSWALWNGIDRTEAWLQAYTEEPDTLKLDDVVLTAAEQVSDARDATVEPLPEDVGAFRPEPAELSPTEGSRETTATPLVVTEAPASPPADTAARPDTSPADRLGVEADPVPPTEPASEPRVAEAATPDMRRVTGDQVNLRKGPNVGTTSLGLLSLDDIVEVLEASGEWVRVRTEDGQEGWVAAEFLGQGSG